RVSLASTTLGIVARSLDIGWHRVLGQLDPRRRGLLPPVLCRVGDLGSGPFQFLGHATNLPGLVAQASLGLLEEHPQPAEEEVLGAEHGVRALGADALL